MKRLFPDVTLTSDEKDHEKWFEDFAAAVMKVREAFLFKFGECQGICSPLLRDSLRVYNFI